MAGIIFLGAPGSGKGTQGMLLSEKINIPNISTGEILRFEVKEKSEIGLEAKRYMDEGNLVPDDIVVGIIEKRLLENDCHNGFILDGFPRNMSQAIILDDMLKKNNKNIDMVFNIEVEDDILIRRISGRFSCKNCGTVYNDFFNQTKKKGVCDNCGSSEFLRRDDDNEQTVKSRLDTYEKVTSELINFYEKKGLIYSVKGVKSIALIQSELCEKIASLNNN